VEFSKERDRSNPPELRLLRAPRQGKIGITDGPFAETKEALGGYYIIDCADLEDARYWAGRLAQTGCGASIEFRPLCAIPQRQDTIAPENEVASTVNA
jgi:hypothetical protein